MSSDAADFSTIHDEDILKRMWQDTEDFGKKKEIRAHMYKIREARLRDFYTNSGPTESETIRTTTTTATTAKKTSSSDTTHADSLADHSFLSLKSKEIRDSESPTRDAYKITSVAKTRNDSGWDVTETERASDDGKTRVANLLATTSGRREIEGGEAKFAAKAEREVSSFRDGDERNYRKATGTSSSDVVRQEARGGDENSKFYSSSVTQKSASEFRSEQKSSSGAEFDDGGKVEGSAFPKESDGKTRVYTETKTLPDGSTVTTTRYETVGSKSHTTKSSSSHSESHHKTSSSSSAKSSNVQMEIEAPQEYMIVKKEKFIDEDQSKRIQDLKALGRDSDVKVTQSSETRTFSKQFVDEDQSKRVQNFGRDSDLKETQTSETRTVSKHFVDDDQSKRVQNLGRDSDLKVTQTSETRTVSKQFVDDDQSKRVQNLGRDSDLKVTQTSETRTVSKQFVDDDQSKRVQNLGRDSDLKVTQTSETRTVSKQFVDDDQSKRVQNLGRDSDLKVTQTSETRTVSKQFLDDDQSKRIEDSKSSPRESDVKITQTRTTSNQDTADSKTFNRKVTNKFDDQKTSAEDFIGTEQVHVSETPRKPLPEEVIPIETSRFETPERREPFKPPKSEMDEKRSPTEGQYDTTYRTDYTSKRISVDVNPTHDAFARSLRSVSPDRWSKSSRTPSQSSLRSSPEKGSRRSPDKTRRTPEKFSSTETFVKSNYNSNTLTKKKKHTGKRPSRSPSPTTTASEIEYFDSTFKDNKIQRRHTEDIVTDKSRPKTLDTTSSSVNKKKKVTERSPTSPLTDFSPKKETKTPSDEKKKQFRRTDTYEERCKEILGLIDDKEGVETRRGSKQSKSPEKTKKSPEKEEKTKKPSKVSEFPAQIKKSPEKEVLEPYPEKVKKPKEPSKISEFPSQIKKSPEKEPLEPYPAKSKKITEPSKICEFPSQIRKSPEREPLEPYPEKVKKPKEPSKVSEFPSQIKKSPEKEPLEPYPGKSKKTTEPSKICEFPSQIRKSPEREPLEPYPEKVRKPKEPSKVSEFPSQIKKSPEKESLGPYPEKSKKTTEPSKICEFPSQIRKPLEKEPLEPYPEKVKKPKEPSKVSEFPSQIKKSPEKEPLEPYPEKSKKVSEPSKIDEFPSQIRKPLEKEPLEPYPEKVKKSKEPSKVSEFPSQLKKSPEKEPLEPYPEKIKKPKEPSKLSEFPSQVKKSPEKEPLEPYPEKTKKPKEPSKVSEFPSQIKRPVEKEPLEPYPEKSSRHPDDFVKDRSPDRVSLDDLPILRTERRRTPDRRTPDRRTPDRRTPDRRTPDRVSLSDLEYQRDTEMDSFITREKIDTEITLNKYRTDEKSLMKKKKKTTKSHVKSTSESESEEEEVDVIRETSVPIELKQIEEINVKVKEEESRVKKQKVQKVENKKEVNEKVVSKRIQPLCDDTNKAKVTTKEKLQFIKGIPDSPHKIVKKDQPEKTTLVNKKQRTEIDTKIATPKSRVTTKITVTPTTKIDRKTTTTKSTTTTSQKVAPKLTKTTIQKTIEAVPSNRHVVSTIINLKPKTTTHKTVATKTVINQKPKPQQQQTKSKTVPKKKQPVLTNGHRVSDEEETDDEIEIKKKQKKCITTKSILIENAVADEREIIVDLKRSKSSREGTPDDICPYPIAQEDRSVLRLPDTVQEPEETIKTKKITTEVINEDLEGFEEKINEVYEDESHLSVNEKVNKFLSTAEEIVKKPNENQKVNREIFDRNLREDDCMLSVSDKVTKFINTAEELTKPKPKIENKTNLIKEDMEIEVSVEENDESLRSVSEKVTHFIEKANKTQRSPSPEKYKTRSPSPKSSSRKGSKDDTKTVLSPTGRLRSTETIKKAKALFENISKEQEISKQRDIKVFEIKKIDKPDEEIPHYMTPLDRSIREHSKPRDIQEKDVEERPENEEEVEEIDEDVPHYMLPLDRSLRDRSPHKDNVKQLEEMMNRSTSSTHQEETQETKVTKFGVTLRRTDSGRVVPTQKIKPSVEPDEIEIEEIFDLEYLEKLLETVVGYDIRRRIRTQIRVVKKMIEERKIEVKTESVRKSKERTKSPEKSIRKSPEKETKKIFQTELKKTKPMPKKSYEEKPEWVTQKTLKKVSETTTTPTKRREVVTTTNKTTKTTTTRREKSPTKEVTDCITSSYGVGPIDENGTPLFGLKALRAQNKSEKTKVQGTVIQSQYYSENGREPIGEISVTKYSSADPKDLVTTTQKFGYKGTPSLKTLTGKSTVTDATLDQSKRTSSKVTRRGSVKEMTRKFIENAVESTTKSERKKSFPKAGLILRTSSFKDSGESSREGSPGYNETKSSTRTVKTASQDTFLSNKSKVTGVQDVITRMKNEEVEGETSEDVEAKNLLNKFIGSQVLLSGMESSMQGSGRKTVTKITTTISENGQPCKEYTKVFTHPITPDLLKTVWDTKTLELLLEQSTDYEDRRVVRARLKEVMAEQEACADLVERATDSTATHTARDSSASTRTSVQGESLLLPLLQGLLQQQRQQDQNQQQQQQEQLAADSGTESGEDLRGGLVAEVLTTLDKLSASLKNPTSSVSESRKNSLLELIERLQNGITSSFSDRRRPSLQVPGGGNRFGRRKPQRDSRHTVGVTAEELEDARRLMEEMGFVGVDNQIKDFKIGNLTAKPFEAELKEDLNSKTAPQPDLIMQTNPLYRGNTELNETDDDDVFNSQYNEKANRFNTKKLKMKRANTIDIPKPLKYYECDDDDSENETNYSRRNSYLALRGPIQVGKFNVNSKKVPEFEAKTENDKKFLAFLNKQNKDYEGSNPKTPWVKSTPIWTNKNSIDKIKSTFEGPKSPIANISSIRNFWKSADDASVVKQKNFGPKISRQSAKNLQQMFEEKQKQNREKINNNKNVVTGSLKVADNIKVITNQPNPINKFNHNPMNSAFRPVKPHKTPNTPKTPKTPEKEITFLYSPKQVASPTSPIIANYNNMPWNSKTSESRVLSIAASKFENPPMKENHQSFDRKPTASKIVIPPVLKQQEVLSSPRIVKNLNKNSSVRKLSGQYDNLSYNQTNSNNNNRVFIPGENYTIQYNNNNNNNIKPNIYNAEYTITQKINFPPLQPQNEINEEFEEHNLKQLNYLQKIQSETQPDFLKDTDYYENTQNQNYTNYEIPQETNYLTAQVQSFYQPYETQKSPKTPPSELINSETSFDDRLQEHSAVNSRVMTGPIVQSASIVQSNSPKKREEHDMDLALNLRNSLQKLQTQESSREVQNPRNLVVFNNVSRKPTVCLNDKPIESLEINENGESVLTGKFHIPIKPETVELTSNLSRSESWHQICRENEILANKPSPRASPNSRLVSRSKSSHSLAVPKQYEAGMSKQEMAEKQKSLQAYFSSSKTQSKEKKSSINRIKTSAKISTQKSGPSNPLSRSQTLPDVICSEKAAADDENIDAMFEEIFKSKRTSFMQGPVTTTSHMTSRITTQQQITKKPMSPFAKFRQLDKQNSLNSPPSTPKTPTGSGSLFKFTDPALSQSANTVKQRLLQWCQRKTMGYENIQLDNFSTSWADGMAFCALIHHFLPDAFDYDALNPKNRRHNFTLAFQTAEDKAGIAPLLDVDDMVAISKPDWKCVFTYVQSIYRRFKDED